MKFKKVYIEITNSCNFDCSFCQPTKRHKHFITEEEFDHVLRTVQPYTRYIYMHVLGEPMLHPRFQKLFTAATSDYGFKVNISTNGSLLKRHRQFLLEHPANQINFSLHDAEENVPEDQWENHLQDIFTFAKETAPHTYVTLRLWNRSSQESQQFNDRTLSKINSFFGLDLKEDIFNTTASTMLSRHIFLNVSPRFDWPDGETVREGRARPCYALRDQIAILCDGTVVPCCIDAEANLALGNIYKEVLSDILIRDRALKLKKGLSHGIFTEDFCKTCGFIIGKE